MSAKNCRNFFADWWGVHAQYNCSINVTLPLKAHYILGLTFIILDVDIDVDSSFKECRKARKSSTWRCRQQSGFISKAAAGHSSPCVCGGHLLQWGGWECGRLVSCQGGYPECGSHHHRDHANTTLHHLEAGELASSRARQQMALHFVMLFAGSSFDWLRPVYGRLPGFSDLQCLCSLYLGAISMTVLLFNSYICLGNQL